MARTFTDTAGWEWTIRIGLYTANRIKELSGGKIDFVDTSRVSDARNALIEMAEDVEMSGRVLWWLCESQATERGICEAEFADAFDLDVLQEAQTAVAEAVIDFFPSRSRPALRRAAELATAAFDREMEVLDGKTQELISSPEFATMIDRAIAGAMSGSSPDLRSVDPLTSFVHPPN